MAFSYSLSKWIPFRDEKACAKARAVTKKDIARHANKKFRIEVIEDKAQFYARFAIDIVERIQKSAQAGKRLTLILPVGPVPQYAIAAEMINRLNLSCKHLVTFNMDEYADDRGKTAPADWIGSFATSMRQSFFEKLDPKLCQHYCRMALKTVPMSLEAGGMDAARAAEIRALLEKTFF